VKSKISKNQHSPLLNSSTFQLFNNSAFCQSIAAQIARYFFKSKAKARSLPVSVNIFQAVIEQNSGQAELPYLE
jgi:hypothetical protein